jgi:hypothetical protein
MADIENPDPVKIECIQLYRQIDETATISDSFTHWEALMMLLKATQTIEDYQQYINRYHTKTYDTSCLNNLCKIWCTIHPNGYSLALLPISMCMGIFMLAAILTIVFVKNDILGALLFCIFFGIAIIIIFVAPCIMFIINQFLPEGCPVYYYHKVESKEQINNNIIKAFKPHISNIDHIISLLKHK